MKKASVKLIFVRYLVLVFTAIFCVATYALSADTVESESDNMQNNASAVSGNAPDDAAFDDFSEFEDVKAVKVFDPLGGYNRFMTRVNDNLYLYLFRPLAKGYSFLVPEPVRVAFERVLNNSTYPVRFVNNLLQLKIQRAGIETVRFCMNTTLGIAGLFDPAKTCMGLAAYPEDFGQTLGYYGVGSGFHIVIPAIGPSNLRDMVGFGPDLFLRPMTYVDDIYVSTGVTFIDHFNRLSLHLDEYDALRQEAIDLYLFQRDAYEMRRQKAIED